MKGVLYYYWNDREGAKKAEAAWRESHGKRYNRMKLQSRQEILTPPSTPENREIPEADRRQEAANKLSRKKKLKDKSL